MTRSSARPQIALSARGIARLVTEFLERLNLDDVTLVGNDTGGAIVQLIAAERPAAWEASCWSPATRSTTSRPA